MAAWNAGELGLEFDDGYVLLDQWVRAGWVDQKSLVPIAALNTRLDEMSGEGNASLWTRQALTQHQAWREVRELATAALIALGGATRRLQAAVRRKLASSSRGGVVEAQTARAPRAVGAEL